MRCPIALIGLALLGGCGGGGTPVAAPSPAPPPPPPPPRLQVAVEKCGTPNGMTVGDAGGSLTIDGKGEDDALGAVPSTMRCVLQGIGIPDYVTSEMQETRALDGRQEASWSGFDASWRYHPDSGLSVIIRDTQSTQTGGG